MKIGPIEVHSSDLNDYLDLEIVAFHWAAAGACGEGGAVVFITTDVKVYHSNYVILRLFTKMSPITGANGAPEVLRNISSDFCKKCVLFSGFLSS